MFYLYILVPLIVKLMRTSCRVPLQLLALRLSILYLRTCVGLGYGSTLILNFLITSSPFIIINIKFKTRMFTVHLFKNVTFLNKLFY